MSCANYGLIDVAVLVDPNSSVVEESNLYELLGLYAQNDVTYASFNLVPINLVDCS